MTNSENVNLMADTLSKRSRIVAERIAGATFPDLAGKYGISAPQIRAYCRRAITEGEATRFQLRMRGPGSIKIVADDEYNRLWIARVRAKCIVSPRGCWEWQGFITNWGYGETAYRGKLARVHRKMYLLTHQVELTREQYVCHACDVPHCCNPEHLWVGTNSDNQKDAGRKGRHSESSKTHCPRNHEYSPENTLIVKSASGGQARHCKTCTRDRHRRRYAQKSEARS